METSGRGELAVTEGVIAAPSRVVSVAPRAPVRPLYPCHACDSAPRSQLLDVLSAANRACSVAPRWLIHAHFGVKNPLSPIRVGPELIGLPARQCGYPA